MTVGLRGKFLRICCQRCRLSEGMGSALSLVRLPAKYVQTAGTPGENARTCPPKGVTEAVGRGSRRSRSSTDRAENVGSYVR